MFFRTEKISLKIAAPVITAILYQFFINKKSCTARVKNNQGKATRVIGCHSNGGCRINCKHKSSFALLFTFCAGNINNSLVKWRCFKWQHTNCTSLCVLFITFLSLSFVDTLHWSPLITTAWDWPGWSEFLFIEKMFVGTTFITTWWGGKPAVCKGWWSWGGEKGKGSQWWQKCCQLKKSLILKVVINFCQFILQ